ncbi:MAG: hypothetical protein ACRC8Q_00235 [Aeromonas sp.]
MLFDPQEITAIILLNEVGGYPLVTRRFSSNKQRPLSDSSQSAAVNLRDSNPCCHGIIPKEGWSFGYVKGGVGALKSVSWPKSVLDQQINQ